MSQPLNPVLLARPLSAARSLLRHGAVLLLLVAVAAGIGLMLVGFPVQPLALGAGLLLAALAVAWRPLLVWVIVPAALPLLDLAPWTGRFFWDEFDALLALLGVVAWWRTPKVQGPAPSRDRLLHALLLAVGLSFAISTGRALLPWPGIDANAFAGLLQPFNALRIVRGAVWGGLLWALARRQRAAGLGVVQAFGDGMVLGLLGAVVAIWAERLAFTHLLDFSDDYRVAGPFSAMHTGGAYVEAYLVCCLPFVVARLWPPAPLWRMVGCASLLMAAVYALMVTFSRGGYAALALGLAVALGLALRHWRGRVAALAFGLVVVVLAALIAGAVLRGSFAQKRLSAIDTDLVIRETHWARVARLIERDAGTLLLGMGLGRLPAVHLLASGPDERSASYRLMEQGGQRLLRLGTGRDLFIDQFVDTQPGQTYQVQVQLRAAAPGSVLRTSLCEKWLIASADCVFLALPVATVGQWTTITKTVTSDGVGAKRGWLTRPVKFSFFVGGTAPLDVASVQLSTADGRPLLRNPAFADGLDHWFFTADHHLAWHAKSMPLAVLFDQGLLGLLAMGGLLALALGRAARAAWRGQGAAAALLVALLAFSTVGMIDTLIDAPRFLMLWLLLCGFAAKSGMPESADTALPGLLKAAA